MTPCDALRQGIEHGDANQVAHTLRQHAHLANERLPLGPDDGRPTCPLHYVSVCRASGQLSNGAEARIARSLVEAGADVDRPDGGLTPLITATTLGVGDVAIVLLEAGAAIETTCDFGATALHWAAYTGLTEVVARLLALGASTEARCSEFGATPLFWAAQGASRHGPLVKCDQIGAARALLDGGARVSTRDREGRPLSVLVDRSGRPAMRALIAE